MKNKYRKPQASLKVKAIPQAKVREIDEAGKPLMAMRFIGYDQQFNVIEKGVEIPYHSHYINQLKLGTLLPMDLQTSQLAGIKMKNKDNK